MRAAFVSKIKSVDHAAFAKLTKTPEFYIFGKTQFCLKTFQVLILTLLLAGRALSQIPTSGLIAYYPFCGNANDVSGNGIHGTVMGAQLSADRFGNANNAYTFDGVSNYINLPAASFAGLHVYSCSLWIKPASTVNNANIAYNVGSSTEPYCHGINYNPPNIFAGCYNNGNSQTQSYVNSPAANLNTWTHIAVTRDLSVLKLYVNGVLAQQLASANTYSHGVNYGTPPYRAVIGTRSNLQNFFSGQIDDVRLYSTVLTQNDVNALYTEPNFSVSVNSGSICAGNSFSLVAVVSGGSYTWMPGGSTNPTLQVTPLSTSVYSLLTSKGECYAPATSTVTVFNAAVTINNATLCSGNSAVLSASPSATGSLSYSWLPGGSVSSSVAVSPSTTAVYTLVTSIYGCSSTATSIIEVITLPIVGVNSPTVSCGSSATLIANPAAAKDVIYTWLPANFTSDSLVIRPTKNSIYTLQVVYKGCSINHTGTVTVSGIAVSITGFSYANPYCASQSSAVPQTTTGFNSGGSYFSEPGLSLDGNTGGIDLPGSSSGTYVVTYSVPQNGCLSAGTGTAPFILDSSPQLQLKPIVKIAPGSQLVMEVNGSENYTWSPASFLSCTLCPNPTASPEESTEYCVSSSNGHCTSRACIKVLVTCDGGDFSVPNAFTPNGDAENDGFCLRGWDLCVKEFSVMIFDRWGEKVYTSRDPNFCWDGTYKGNACGPDVFVYVIEAFYPGNQKVTKKGNITLIK